MALPLPDRSRACRLWSCLSLSGCPPVFRQGTPRPGKHPVPVRPRVCDWTRANIPLLLPTTQVTRDARFLRRDLRRHLWVSPHRDHHRNLWLCAPLQWFLPGSHQFPAEDTGPRIRAQPAVPRCVSRSPFG